MNDFVKGCIFMGACIIIADVLCVRRKKFEDKISALTAELDQIKQGNFENNVKG